MNQDKNIGLIFKILSNQMKRKIDSKLNNHVTNIQMFILRYIDNTQDDIYQKNIEQVLDIRRSTTTEILNVMEREGLIKRKSIDNDKRKRKIILTSKGKEYVNTCKKTISEIEEALLENITEKEKEVFFNVLEKIKNNINNI